MTLLNDVNKKEDLLQSLIKCFDQFRLLHIRLADVEMA